MISQRFFQKTMISKVVVLCFLVSSWTTKLTTHQFKETILEFLFCFSDFYISILGVTKTPYQCIIIYSFLLSEQVLNLHYPLL